MNCHDCQPLLSSYIDESVRADERAAVAAHVRTCIQCRTLVEELSAIRDAVGALEPIVPPARIWHQLSAAAAAEPRRVQFGWFNWRPLLATAMAAVIAAGLWQVGTLLQSTNPTAGASQAAEAPVVDADSDPEAHYTVAIARLEEVTHADRDVLDQETAGAMNAGLMVIDDAITESRAALRAEPQSESAQESLTVALGRKVALLQDMVALISDMRKGESN
jgi:hypothetical protein